MQRGRDMGQQHPGWQGNQNQPPGGFPQGPYPPQGQYPQQQWYQPPAGPPPQKPKNKKFWLWLAPLLVVVVAAAVVVPIVLTSGSDPAPARAGGPEQPASKSWQVHLDRPEHEKGLGSWEVGDTVVVAHEGAITAFAKGDGKQAWRTPAPEGGKFCGAGTRVVGDQLPVAYGKELTEQKDPVCQFAAVLNVKTGQLGWQQPFDAPQGSSPSKPTGAALEIMGDVVVLAQKYGTVGLDLATGQRRWVKPVVKPTGGDSGSSAIMGMRPGKQSLVVSLSGFISDPAITFATLDPATGTLSQGVDYTSKDSSQRFATPRLLSADPPVALVNRGVEDAVYIVMDDKFDKVGTIDAGHPGTAESLAGDGAGVDAVDNRQPGRRFLISGGLFVTVTAIPLNGTNKLVAYDIASGAKKWERPLADGKAIMPLAVEGDSVVVLVSPATPSGDQRIARFSLADGAPGPVETYPLATPSGGAPITQDFQYFWHDGRLWALRGPSNEHDFDAFSLGK
ncbi:outer membrane protein assembly factor BamB family protein [Amycolatopsis sp. CA-230715]|uniref:outer membrane protein assembly factor BamB family protein n=1 Tax=Amycolatopsis sp. CA-230715 TaxID=2745196 RepID=UPI001C02A23E|nr:PQQ-binding-like beta-propeller repeat protein [Amycolatopsis sp. CA-230715]